jgi:DNA polymerase elongation subunit (family B)
MDTTNCRMVHCVAQSKDGTSHLVANIKDVNTNESKLLILREPVRPFWITKKGYQTHKDKKLCVPDYQLVEHVCPEHKMTRALHKALGWAPSKELFRAILLDSPYVYGADIGVSVIYKKQLRDACAKDITAYNIGALDIETSVCGGEEVILISYIAPSGDIYQAILKSFMGDHHPNEIDKMFKEKIAGVREQFLPPVQGIFDKLEWKTHYFIHTSEVALIQWIFDAIHKTKPDFITIWNMGFDIPYLLKRLKFHNIDTAQMLCHPEVPNDLRVCFYKDDERDVEHFTDKWHWFSLSGYTQFIDAQALYSRLRKVIGRESSYALQYIASKILGTGKLEFGETDTHFSMQTKHFIDYAVYNIFDSILLRMLELVNCDILNMMNLIDVSDLRDFSRQTVQLRNSFYDYCRKLNMVTASIGSPATKEWDDQINNVGGGVLDPMLVRGTGVVALQESDEETKLHRLVADFDATGKLSAPCSCKAA